MQTSNLTVLSADLNYDTNIPPIKRVNFIISAKMTPLNRTLMKLNSTFKHQTVHSNMQIMQIWFKQILGISE